jgi:4-amino-4-deoxychorismate lyase
LQTGCINGIVRQQLLRAAPDLGISLQEGLYKPEVLCEAQAVFCANVMGIQWLNEVNNDNIAPSDEVKQRLNALWRHIQG